MNTRSLHFALSLCALWLSGCADTGITTPKYVYYTRPPGQRVGIRETCPRYYDPPRSGFKITLPSVGYGGASVNLGSYELDPAQVETVSDVLTLIDQGRWNTCCSIRDAAEAGDWSRYDRLNAIEDDNTQKIAQIEMILATHNAAEKSAGDGAAKAKARANLTQELAKWTEAYGSSGQHMMGVQAKTAARTAMLVKDVHTEHMKAMDANAPVASVSKPEAGALAVPAKSNSYFNLPPPPAKAPAPQ